MPLSDEKIINLYKNYRSCSEIAAVDGRSSTYIYNKLKKLGVHIRSRSEANQIFQDRLLINLYNIGLSTSQIGRLLGIDASTATKRFRTMGFPMRTRNIAHKIRYTEEEFKRYFMNKDTIEHIMELTG